MKLDEIAVTASALFADMRRKNYSQETLSVAEWVIQHFKKYCVSERIRNADIRTAALFLSEKYGIDIKRPANRTQIVLRRPLLILIDFYATGEYRKSYLRGELPTAPFGYEKPFSEYLKYLNTQDIAESTKKEKRVWTCRFLHYLLEQGINRINEAKKSDVHEYLCTLTTYVGRTRVLVASILREMLNWMHKEGMIGFSGHDVLPRIKASSNRSILSYYTKDEVSRTLQAIDTSTRFGKGLYFAATTAALTGLRIGDIINLKFGDIDWENGNISIIQQKTRRPLSLPLPDEAMYALVDYLKNGRYESDDKEHILITCKTPHTKYKGTSSFSKPLSKYMELAGVESDGRHRGMHSLRHSLATGLVGNNVPLSVVSGVLGHLTTRSTEVYIGVDETHLKEISLEVDDVL